VKFALLHRFFSAFAALVVVVVAPARADVAPTLNVFPSGGGNPNEGTVYTFVASVQLDLNARGVQRVQSGNVDFGDGASGYAFSTSNGGFVNYVTMNVSPQKVYFTAGSYTATVSATVFWVNSAQQNQQTNVTTTVPITVNNIAPTLSTVFCFFSQVDDFGIPIPSPTVPRGVPCTFYGGATDPGATTLTASWQLDEDGQYDDAIYSQSNQQGFMPTATKAFYNLGSRFVRFKVSDAQGASNVPQTFAFTVDAQQPTPTTGAATNISTNGATLNGTMDLKSMVGCTAIFQYGTDQVNYGLTVQQAVNPGDTTIALPITGLDDNTTYHYRLTILDGGGLTAFGSDGQFSTPPAGPPVGVADDVACSGSEPLTIDVLANDGTAGSRTLVSVSTPLFGTAVISSGKIVYTPGTKFKGTDQFTYVITDGTANSAPIEVTIFSNRGTYQALVSLPGGPAALPENGGHVAGGTPTYTGLLTLTVGFDNRFTGKLKLGSQTVAVKGQFDANGEVQIIIDQKPPKPDLTVDLALDLSDPNVPAPAITGTVSDGTNTYEIEGDRSADPKTFPAAVLARYAVVIDPPADTALPQGYGHGFLTVKKGGKATFIGKRNDGKPFAFAGTAGDGASWSFIKGFVPSPKGNVAATLSISDDGTNDLAGTFYWNKAASTKGLYQPAFNVALAFVGSRYTAPGKTAHALTYTAIAPAPATAEIELIDVDGLALSLSPLTATFDAKDSFAATPVGADKFAGKTGRAAGTFSGSFILPGSTEKAKFSGVLLQRQNVSRGLFSTKAGTGAVTVTPQ